MLRKALSDSLPQYFCRSAVAGTNLPSNDPPEQGQSLVSVPLLHFSVLLPYPKYKYCHRSVSAFQTMQGSVPYVRIPAVLQYPGFLLRADQSLYVQILLQISLSPPGLFRSPKNLSLLFSQKYQCFFRSCNK